MFRLAFFDAFSNGKLLRTVMKDLFSVWKRVIPLFNAVQTFSNVSDRETVDLAIMANHCHTIILTAIMSTFGLWGAYLSDGTVYYASNIDDRDMKNKTEISTFTSTDRILPSWIPMQL